MKRWEERVEDYQNAFNRLKEGFLANPSDLEIDGTIQRFEFTFELSWKCMKDYLEKEGIISNLGSPREIISLAFQYHLIDDGENWIQMMLDGNRLSHLYDNQVSREIYDKIKTIYIQRMEELLEKFQQEN